MNYRTSNYAAPFHQLRLITERRVGEKSVATFVKLDLFCLSCGLFTVRIFCSVKPLCFSVPGHRFERSTASTCRSGWRLRAPDITQSHHLPDQSSATGCARIIILQIEFSNYMLGKFHFDLSHTYIGAVNMYRPSVRSCFERRLMAVAKCQSGAGGRENKRGELRS